MNAFDRQNFYYATTPRPPAHAPLSDETRADVCIVGGGISGLSAALHLAERGFSVALLEAEHLGFGGSGRSGGQTIFGYASGQEKLEKLVRPGRDFHANVPMIRPALKPRLLHIYVDWKRPNQLSIEPERHLSLVRPIRAKTRSGDSNQVFSVSGKTVRHMKGSRLR